MTDHPGFLADILANPSDDFARHVCADWLEDNGQAERAEFIKVQCRLANPGVVDRMVSHWPPEGQPAPPGCGCEPCRLLRREWELLNTIRTFDWCGDWTISAMPGTPACQSLGGGQCGFYYDRVGDIPWLVFFRRGFITEFHAPLAALMKHLPALVRRHPPEVACATDKGPSTSRQGVPNVRPPFFYLQQDDEIHQGPDVGHWLPRSIHVLMVGRRCVTGAGEVATIIEYPTIDDANRALSDALLSWARRERVT